jgi:hypothetical protein
MKAEDFLDGPAAGGLPSAEKFLDDGIGKPAATDYLKGVASGVGGLVSGVGYLAEAAGANRVGASIRGIGDTTQQYWQSAMTPAGQRAAQSQVFEDDPNSALPRLGDNWGQALAMGAAQSAPSMLAAALPGGIAAAGLRGAAGMAASRGIGGALAPLAAGTAAPVGGWATNFAGNVAARAPAALGFGAAEGAVAGASNAAQWKSDIEQRPEQELDKMPRYAQLKAQIGPAAARRQIAEQGAADIMARTTLATGGIGALTGGGALGSAFQRMTTGAKGGIAGAIARDAAKEAGQEIPQSGGERAIQNLATRDYLDPNQSAWQGVVADALSGGAIGGLMGGVTGGASHLAKGPLQKAVEVGSATVSPNGGIAAGIPAGNSQIPAVNAQPAADGRGAGAAAASADASVRDLVQAAAAEMESDKSPVAAPPQQNTPAAPGNLSASAPTAAPSLPTNQAEPAGVPVSQQRGIPQGIPRDQAGPAGSPASQQQQGALPRGNETEITKPAAAGQQAQPATTSNAAGAVSNTDAQPAPTQVGQDVNMQNRDRSRAASVIQMGQIARNPDYMRLGPSRAPDSGAPMVFAVNDDHSRIPAMNFGNGDVAVMSDGQRVPFRYAIVSASQVEPSNFADGRVNPAFAAPPAGAIKALNNGRTAGLRAAYEIGSAGTYQAELANDLANVGISLDALRATPNPILVRVYSDAANAPGMATKSQAQGLGMSPAELARQDAPLIDSSVLEMFRPGDVAAADKEAKARQDAEKARRQAEDLAEIRRRSDAAAQTFELGGDAMANLTGQGDMFGGSPDAEAPSREPTSNAGALPPGANPESDDLGALFDAELDAAFSKPKEKSNEPGSVRNSQRDRKAADAQQGDEGAVSNERGRESATPGDGVRVPDANSRRGRPGGPGVSGAGTASGGKRGDQPVPGTKRPAGVEKLPAGDNQRQGSSGVRPGGVAASGGESPAAAGGPAGGSVGPRSASEAGKSAAKNAGMALSEVAKGLNALFKPRPGTLGSGPSFDEDTYAAAKPYFQAGLAHVRQAGADIVEMMRALIAAMRDQFGMDKDTIAAMKPYVVRYIGDVKAGREAIEETNPQDLKKDKIQQQRGAETIKVIVGDKANIDATLPFLTEGQREDVLFAEKRWTTPDGYGVLFTNGTGTGKTFLALGAIKRFAKQGKGNGIVVVPNEAVMNEWVKSAPALGLQVNPLTDTKDAGSGIAITTYANFGQNDEIAKRDYDFVAIDEAHLLMLGKDAEPTKALGALRAVSLHPDGVLQRAEMQNRTLVDRIARTRKEIDSITKSVSNLDTMEQVLDAAQRKVSALKKDLDADVKEWYAILERTKVDVIARQGEKRPRVMFLSATPFAYEPSVQWGEGFLYDFPKVTGRGYNAPSGYQKFMMQHFGWRMRHGKLTQPTAEVDSDLMQRQFNTWLRKEGVLSARMLDVDHDYQRKFILIQGGVGQTIDDGLRWLRETDNGRYWGLYHAINEKFDYLTRSRLLEAIKARAAIPYIKKHHALGRKVVVFYDFNSGGGINVFNLSEQLAQVEAGERSPGYDIKEHGVDVPVRGQGNVAYGQIKTEKIPLSQLIREFMAARPDLQEIDFRRYGSPLTTLLQAFPGAGVYNGMSQYKKTRIQSIRDFNDDAKPEANLLLVQKTANAGWSGHDTTGKHGRVVINLGLPVAPIEAIQQEGRIYRVGQKSDANFQYFNTGTNWERYAFGSKIARRAGAAENLAMGEQARGLREAFIQAFENSDPDYEPGEADGKGGKAGDRDLVSAITEWDRARSLYFAQQKKTSRTKAAEGEDYYATPEPLGLKMVEWAGILPGDRVLEPSAGHGAIARWFPDKNDRTAIEPSLELASRLALATDAKLINERFENHDTINKYDAIVMNPPFGVGGKTAIEHLDKAFRHLTDGGRIVALIPEGPAANKRFDDWLYGDKQVKAKPVTSNLGTFGAVFLGDTATVETSGGAGIAGGGIGTSTATGKVTGFREGKLFVQREGSALATGYLPDQVRSVQPTGARTATVKSAPDAYLRASISLPAVTFERAGTAVKTRVVVVDKISEPSRLRGLAAQSSRDIDADSIKELFDRIENMDVAGRALPEEKARAQKQEADFNAAKAANAGKTDDAGIVQPSGAPATVETIQEPEKPGGQRKLLTDAPRVKHVTKAGKTIFGVIAKRLTKDQAASIDPYMWAKDGGFFIRMAHVVRPQNVVEQERGVYTVNEPDSITKDVFRGTTSDLFAGTEHALSNAGRSHLPGRKSLTTSPARASAGPAARVLAVRQAPDTPGIYYVSTQLVTVGERDLPVERIRTTEDAAKAFAYLPKWAVEHYDAIVTDKNGKPLAIIGGFKGDVGSTSAPPSTLIGELSRIENANSLWTAHNHPSGLATLSSADRNLDRILGTALDGSGIEYRGLFAMAGARSRAGVVKYDHTTVGAGEVRVTNGSSFKVPVVDRELVDPRDDVETINGPAAAFRIIPQIAGDSAGVVFLDSQNGASSFVPFSGEEMGAMRVHGRLMNLFRAVSKANARAAVIADPGGKLSEMQKSNLKTALSNVDVRLLDVISYGSGMNPVSQADTGKEPDTNPGSVVFSLAGQQSGAAVGAPPTDRAVYEMAQDGKPTSEILAFLSKASRRPFNRVLATALQKAGLQTSITVDSQVGWQVGNRSYAQRYAAAYSPRADKVALFTPRDAERHVLHELTHAATLKAIEAGGMSAARMKSLFNHVAKSGKLEGMYGMTNVDEFVAEAFSNPKFREALQGVPAPAGSPMKNAWEWFVRIVARIVGFKTQAADTALDRVLREGVALMSENAAMRAQSDGGDRFAIAWHGTPHVWAPEPGFPHGRPRLDKIGTGEGAQAYGWGWYSAETAGVAKGYQDTLAYKAFDIAQEAEKRGFRLNAGGRGEFLRQVRTGADEMTAAKRLQYANIASRDIPKEKLAELIGAYRKDGGGQLYQLDIPDDVMPKLLDWNKTLSEQSPEVRAILQEAGFAITKNSYPTLKQAEALFSSAKVQRDASSDIGIREALRKGWDAVKSGDQQAFNNWFDVSGSLLSPGRKKDKTGQQFYEELSSSEQGNIPYSKQKASEYLASIGIPGLRYLDAGSRDDGKGTYNYVIWDQPTLDRIALLERNGEKLDAIREADAVRFSRADTLPETISVDGIDRQTRNSKGQQIHPTEDGVRNFWQWFGDSKVVDDEGRPLVVYHGSDTEITEFEPGRRDPGVWFTSRLETAAGYAKGDNPEIYDVYLKAENQFVADFSSWNGSSDIEFDGKEFDNNVGIVKHAQRLGNDSVVFPVGNFSEDDLTWVVFNPEQIKSATGNTGTFDATDPDIRFNVSSTQPAVTPHASPGNLWQAAKAKAAAILTPGRIDKLIYELQDKYVDLRRIRDHIREVGGTITDMNDAYLGEELYHKRLAHRTQNFLKDELRPLLTDMKARGVGMQELESFLHARHAPEANAEMAKRNPNQAEIDAGQTKAAAVVRRLELNLQTAQARGLATKAIEQALNDARGDLAKWNGAQAFSGTEEERRSLSGMTNQASAAIMAGLSPQRRADLDALATRVDDINASTLQHLDDYGLMSKESLNAWRRTYQFYVPLHRDEAHPDSAKPSHWAGLQRQGRCRQATHRQQPEGDEHPRAHRHAARGGADARREEPRDAQAVPHGAPEPASRRVEGRLRADARHDRQGDRLREVYSGPVVQEPSERRDAADCRQGRGDHDERAQPAGSAHGAGAEEPRRRRSALPDSGRRQGHSLLLGDQHAVQPDLRHHQPNARHPGCSAEPEYDGTRRQAGADFQGPDEHSG